ncbi:MAG: hypothetical protein HQL93_07925 [Magnetococcales bacterium]|nr:hypothetical protein [Magnetococcales bacterium]
MVLPIQITTHPQQPSNPTTTPVVPSTTLPTPCSTLPTPDPTEIEGLITDFFRLPVTQGFRALEALAAASRSWTNGSKEWDFIQLATSSKPPADFLFM